MQKNTKLRPLEFRVFRELKERPELQGKRVLIACSGGADSVALAYVLARLGARIGFDVALAHVHHGLTDDPIVNSARARAAKAVRRLAEKLALKFFLNEPFSSVPSTSAARSEESMRRLRHGVLRKWKNEHGFDFVALAHHKDDLVETRLIRLIRGTGASGLLAMRAWDPPLLRPFLGEPRMELERYLVEQSLKWIKDPTNRRTEPLRNWIRRTWLPALEKKRPGACEAIGRSLENIVESLERAEVPLEKYGIRVEGDDHWIDRKAFQRLKREEQKEGVALFFREIGVRDFGRSHVEEFCKRLDTSRKNLTFQLVKRRWEINAERILAQ